MGYTIYGKAGIHYVFKSDFISKIQFYYERKFRIYERTESGNSSW